MSGNNRRGRGINESKLITDNNRHRRWPSRLKLISSNNRRRRWQSGQMTVELALLTPVVLVLVYITVNLLLYLAACARFDPLAAEAVRTQAASPASGCYALSSRAAATAYWLQQNFNDQNNVQIAVSAERVAYGGNLPEQLPGGENLGVVFALLPQQERFSCVLYFQPLGWPGSLFGLELPAVQHHLEFVIDPYRPGAVF